MALIDSHAHLTFSELADSLPAVLERSCAAGVDGWITVGTDAQNNSRAIEVAQENENVWATVGFHPHYAKDVSDRDLEIMQEQLTNSKVVAAGELGLDYHYDFSPREVQQRIFRMQLDITSNLRKPVIIHSREAFDDTLVILDEYKNKLDKIVIHCFGGDAAQAKFVVEKGFYVSFTGVVTFKNAQSARDAAAAVPLDKLMVETDCPYMSPAPMRKQKINEPALMIHTAEKLAEIHGVSLQEFCEITEKTTRDFFEL